MANTGSKSGGVKLVWAIVCVAAAAVIAFAIGYGFGDDSDQVAALQGQLSDATKEASTQKSASETKSQQIEELQNELAKTKSDAADQKKALEDQVGAANGQVATLESEKAMRASQVDTLQSQVDGLQDALRQYLSNTTEVDVPLARDGVWLVDKQVSVYLSYLDPKSNQARIKVGDSTGEASAVYYTISTGKPAAYRYLGKTCQIGLAKIADKTATISFQCP
jgi:ABC-type transporter Mla subunit MlaD